MLNLLLQSVYFQQSSKGWPNVNSAHTTIKMVIPLLYQRLPKHGITTFIGTIAEWRVKWLTYGVCVGVRTIVDHEDATYPPSVGHSWQCPTEISWDKKHFRHSFWFLHRIVHLLTLPLLSLYTLFDIVEVIALNPLITPGSYLLKCPQGVHYRLDFLLAIKTQELVHHRFHKTTFPVLEQEVEEWESCYNFVFLI